MSRRCPGCGERRESHQPEVRSLRPEVVDMLWFDPGAA